MTMTFLLNIIQLKITMSEQLLTIGLILLQPKILGRQIVTLQDSNQRFNMP